MQNGATEVDGKDANGDVVFTLSIDATGQVTMTELRGVHEDAATTTPTATKASRWPPGWCR